MKIGGVTRKNIRIYINLPQSFDSLFARSAQAFFSRYPAHVDTRNQDPRISTWRVGGRVQGHRRHYAGTAAGDRVLIRVLMRMRMMARKRLRLLVRGVIGVERFVACHQRVQHLEHHFRRRDRVSAATAAAIAAYRSEIAAAVRVRFDYYARRLPRRPRRPDAHDARRDVALDCPTRRRRR